MEMSLAGRQLGTAVARAACRRHAATSLGSAMLPSAEHQRAAARLGRLLSSLGTTPQQRLTPVTVAAGESASASTAAPPSAASASRSAAPALASGYRLPPKEIADIVDAPPEPLLSFSPNRELVMQLSRPPSNPPISELARPELKLAGEQPASAVRRSRGLSTACTVHSRAAFPRSLCWAGRSSTQPPWAPRPSAAPRMCRSLLCPLPTGLRIDPETFSRSRMSYYTGITYAPFTDVGATQHGWVPRAGMPLAPSPAGPAVCAGFAFARGPPRLLELTRCREASAPRERHLQRGAAQHSATHRLPVICRRTWSCRSRRTSRTQSRASRRATGCVPGASCAGDRCCAALRCTRMWSSPRSACVRPRLPVQRSSLHANPWPHTHAACPHLPQINYVTWSPDSKTIAFTLRRCVPGVVTVNARSGLADPPASRRTLTGHVVQSSRQCSMPTAPAHLPASDVAPHPALPAWAQPHSSPLAAFPDPACSAGGDSDPPRQPLELWVADMATGQARRLMEHRLNSTFEE